MGEASRRHSHSVPTVCRHVLATHRISDSSSSSSSGSRSHESCDDDVAIADFGV